MLRDEIKDCMRSLDEANGEIHASFVFPAGFTGFDGHFPDNPILPGICTIQAAAVMMQQTMRRRPCIREIRFAKFFNVVRPDDRLDITCRPDPGDPGDVRVTVACGDTKTAELGLSLSYGPGQEPHGQPE